MRAVLVNDGDSWNEMYSKLDVAQTISFDTETTCLDPHASYFDCVGISLAVDRSTGFYIPLNHTAPVKPVKTPKRPKGMNPAEWKPKARTQGMLFYPDGRPAEEIEQLDVDWVIRRLKPLLETRSIMGHGLKFDYQVMKVLYGIDLNIQYDSMAAAHILDERLPVGLKFLTEHYLGYKPMSFGEAAGGGKSRGKVNRKARSNFESVPLDKATVYAAPDAVNPIRLREIFRPHFEENQKFRNLLSLEIPVIKYTAEMELTGCDLDTNHLAGMHRELLKAIDHKLKIIRELTGKPELNPGSSQQMVQLLYTDMGLINPSKRKGKKKKDKQDDGKKSQKGMMARKTVEKLRTRVERDDMRWRLKAREKHWDRQVILDVITQYLELTRLEKLNSTYTHTLIDAVSDDGRLHTNYHQHGTKSGRFASSDPNFQNMPRNSNPDDPTYHYDVRRAFRAGWAGSAEEWVFVLVDYKAMEMRICAAQSGCRDMREIVTGTRLDKNGDPIDIHLYTACTAFSINYDEAVDITHDEKHPRYRDIKEKRQQAKAVNFGIIYGITEHGLAAGLNRSVQFALDIKNGFMRAYPGVARWMSQTKLYLRANLHTATAMGRRRRISWLEARDNEAFNTAYRACLNHQIQGTGADIVKAAIPKVGQALTGMGVLGRIVGQVHDEIIVHCPINEYERIARATVQAMDTELEGIKIETEAEVKRTWSKLEKPLWKYDASGAQS